MRIRSAVYAAVVVAVVAAACAAPPASLTDTETSTDTGTETTTAGTDESDRVYSVAEIGTEFGDAVWRVEVSACGVESTGSAFAIADDLLVTNEHVVTFDTEPIVVSRDGRELAGRVIGMAPWVDIAVIEVAEPLGQQLTWRPAAELIEGEAVIALGYPAPLMNFSVAPGTLLSFDVTDGERTAILSDEPSDYGSSGGPLMDTTGQVIGVVTEFSDDSAAQLTGFSSTYELVGDVIDEIVANPQQLETRCDGIEYGSDPGLDALWDLCESEDAAGPDACDELMAIAPAASRYEDFGFNCGDRFDSPDELCVDLDY